MSLNANPDPQLRHFHAQILEKKKPVRNNPDLFMQFYMYQKISEKLFTFKLHSAELLAF